ncbi:MAG: acylphosphatase [Gammaproteobacteria bacterium]
MNSDQCIRYFVSGRVQGVFFRAATRQRALALDLSGWVRNLPDGQVEVLACGEKVVLEALHEWLRTGPPHAHVTAVNAVSAPLESIEGFKII